MHTGQIINKQDVTPSTNLSFTPLVILLSDFPFTSKILSVHLQPRQGVEEEDKHERILTKKRFLKDVQNTT